MNANLVFTWRRKYLAEQQAAVATLLPVTIVDEAPSETRPVPVVESEIVKPVVPSGTIEVRIGRAVIKVDGVVDTEMLRAVLESLRS
ncbi:transposase [Burkholderia ubonensis]|uniref:Transposase n=1 Tax=Burkholderia ubonensis TaxID=101571 RepID=A0A107EVK3_9BURK|nr:transposase [Burkholderia ubonensis]KWD88081.1 transposase [Burkholderia ubonensis]KWD91431.1 transposase [Burkholderia ubonensis]KWD92193.1 transposase [Burkholderia ubonensis]